MDEEQQEEYLLTNGWIKLPCDNDSEQKWEDLGGAVMITEQAIEQQRMTPDG